MRVVVQIIVFLMTFAGFLASMTVPIMIVGFISIGIWGPELMHRSLGPEHPSTYFFLLLVPAGIVISGIAYVAVVILPVFSKYDIPVSGRIIRILASWMRRRAIRYAQLMERY
jgi:hypothetical protein